MQHLLTQIQKHRFIALGICLLVVLAIGGGAYFLTTRSHSSPPPEDKEVVAQKEARAKTAKMIDAVEKQIALPSGEEPLIATVSDREALQEQEFFKEAQNGDKILMYPKNKKAFLYRPSINQVLAQAPLQYGDTPAVAATASAQASDSGDVVSAPRRSGKVLIPEQ